MKQENNKPGDLSPKKKINGLEAIARVVTFVCENPNIKPENRRRVVAEMLEPMLEKIFGNDYDPYDPKKDTGT